MGFSFPWLYKSLLIKKITILILWDDNPNQMIFHAQHKGKH